MTSGGGRLQSLASGKMSSHVQALSRTQGPAPGSNQAWLGLVDGLQVSGDFLRWKSWCMQCFETRRFMFLDQLKEERREL